MPTNEAHSLLLYGIPRTRTTRARWWLEEIGIEYKFINVDIEKDEQDDESFRKLSPLGRIPVLVDGQMVLFEIMAIGLYLSEKYPSPKLYRPRHGTARSAIYAQWMSFTTTELDQAIGRYHLHHIARHSVKNKGGLDAAKAHVAERIKPYEDALKRGDFLMGDKISGVDIYSGSLLAFADTLGLISRKGPLRKWLNNLTSMPSYKRALLPIQDKE